MDYHTQEIGDAEFDSLEQALKLKDRHLQAEGISHLPAVFDLGDQVGFFFGPRECDHAKGVITEDCDENGRVTVRCANGNEFKVSVFLIFPLPK